MVINSRLKRIADYVRQGSVAADIGTDHAYLPIFLVQNGICKRVIATDINENPCKRAIENVRLHKLSDKIDIIQCDGLCGIANFSPTDIIIAGMGGELIRDIVLQSDYVKNSNIRLILQSMTRTSILRESLLSAGFDIADESLVAEDRRIYEILCVNYVGYAQIYGEIDLLLGKKNIEKHDILLPKLIEKHIKVMEKKPNGGNIIQKLRELL